MNEQTYQPGFLELTVLSGILKDPVIAAFRTYRNGDLSARAAFLHELFEHGAENNFAEYVKEAVVADENASPVPVPPAGTSPPTETRLHLRLPRSAAPSSFLPPTSIWGNRLRPS